MGSFRTIMIKSSVLRTKEKDFHIIYCQRNPWKDNGQSIQTAGKCGKNIRKT